jgi:copper resistance protein D
VGGPTTRVMRWQAIVFGVAVVLGGAAAAWAVAYPQAAPAATAVRGLADCAGVVTLGLSVVPMLDVNRYRNELARKARRPVAAAAGLWMFAELCRLAVGAAEAAAAPVTRVGLATTVEFAWVTSAGRSILFSIAAAGLVLLVALVGRARPPATIAASGLAAAGLVARAIGGHMSASSLGAIAIAIHGLAAALWCGTLAALVLTVDHRGQWARVLPRFSALALVCVIALLAGGVVGALVAPISPPQLFATGYGRVLLVKVVLAGALLLLAWRNRARWLPAAKSHRVTAYVSRSRSLIELAIMAAALTMAAALSIAG